MAKYLGTYCIAAHQQVGSFEVTNQFGVLRKNGGNVASYLCTPDGRVVHAWTGPVPAREVLEYASWGIETYKKTGQDSQALSEAHRREADQLAQDRTNRAQEQIHRLLAENPLPPLNKVYRTIFEDILGQRISKPDSDITQAERAFAAAKKARVPILLILHKSKDNQGVLQEWDRRLADGGLPQANTLAELAKSYVVVALPLEELAAMSSQIGLPPYAAPDGGDPLFVIARSNGRQLSAVTTWNKRDALAYSMAQGLVQEAKEHDRSLDQLQQLGQEVEPIDSGLANEVLALVREAKSSRPKKSVDR